MTRQRTWTVLAPLAVCALLLAWIVLSAASIPSANFSILVYGLANLIVYTDALDFALRLFVRRRHTATARECGDNRNLSINLAEALPQGARRIMPAAPYAIIASVYNLDEDLDAFMEGFGPYRDRTWIVSDGSTDHTLARLRQAEPAFQLLRLDQEPKDELRRRGDENRRRNLYARR